jgi:hypothetical protein
MPASGTGPRPLNALRPALEGSRPWAWLTAVVAAASAAAYLTAAAGPADPGPGTSAATPLWAAVIALADQDAGRRLGFVNPSHLRHRPRPRLPQRVP